MVASPIAEFLCGILQNLAVSAAEYRLVWSEGLVVFGVVGVISFRGVAVRTRDALAVLRGCLGADQHRVLV